MLQTDGKTHPTLLCVQSWGKKKDDVITKRKYLFSADRTNGRAIGTVLRPSVVCRRLCL